MSDYASPWSVIENRAVEARLFDLREALVEMLKVVDSPHFRRAVMVTFDVSLSDGEHPFNVAMRIANRRLRRRLRVRQQNNKYAARPLLKLLQERNMTGLSGEGRMEAVKIKLDGRM